MNRKPLKLIGLTLLHWLLLLAGVFVGTLIAYSFSEDTGRSHSAGLLFEKIYAPHPILFWVGAAVSAAAIACVWIFLLKKDLLTAIGLGKGWIIAFVLLSIAGTCAILYFSMLALAVGLDLFCTFEPAYAEWYFLLLPVYALILAVVIAAVSIIQRKGKQHE